MSEYTETDEAEMRSFVCEMLPEALWEHAEDFAQLRLKRMHVEAFVMAARKAQHEWWTSAVDEVVARRLDVAMGKVAMSGRGDAGEKRHTTTVRLTVKEEDKNWLRTEFSGVTDLVFQAAGRGEPVEHSRANVARTVAIVQMRRMLPRGARVLEVGAKIEHAVIAGAPVGTYMGVVPVLDASDSQRQTQSTRSVKLMLARKGVTALKENQRAVATAYLHDFSSMFTRKRVQEVEWAADAVFSLDANYDIPMADIPRVMHRTGAKVWFGSMVRCEAAAMVYTGRKRGQLPIGFDYDIDASSDRITFSFRSSSRPYRHRLSIYREYMSYNHRVFRMGGAQFVYSVLPQTTRSQLMFAVHRIPDRPYREQIATYIPTGGLGMLRIRTLEVRNLKTGSPRPSFFDMSEDAFSHVLQERMLMSSSAEDSEVFRMVRGARVGVVVNGVRVSIDNPLSEALMPALVAVLNVVSADMFRSGAKVSTNANALIRAGGYREAGLLSTVGDWVWSSVAGPGTFVELVKFRLGEALVRDSGALGIERLPAFKELGDVVCQDLECLPIFPVSLCYCQERTEAEAIVDGDRGGLSAGEYAIMQRYVEKLKKRRCESCEFDPLRVVLDGERCGPDIDIEDCDDKFYDAQSEVGSVGGSETSQSCCFESADEERDSTDDSGSDTSSVEEVERFESGLVEGQQQLQRAVGFSRDAIGEYVEIMGLQMEAADSEAKKYAAMFARTGEVNARVLEAAYDGRRSHHVLQVDRQLVCGIVGSGAEAQDFRRVYDWMQGKFFDLERLPSGQCVVSKFCSARVYTNTDFRIRNQPALIKVCRSVLNNGLVGPVVSNFRFVNGVFGCGKTYEIVQSYRAGNLYLSATANSVKAVRKRLYRGASEGEKFVRTYDSALMHGVPKAEVVLLDELPMAHAGQVLALIEKIKPRTIVGYGDFHQICYISFLAAYRMRFASLREHCVVEHRVTTHRCRVSVCAAVLQFYGEDSGLAVCGCHEHLLEEEGFDVRRVQTIQEVPMRKVKYAAFKHWEQAIVREELQKAGFDAATMLVDLEEGTSDVSTVHTLQGDTYDELIVVRLDKTTKPGAIYFQDDQVLVALTRARLKVTYYTCSDEIDGISAAWERSNQRRLRNIVRKNSGREEVL